MSEDFLLRVKDLKKAYANDKLILKGITLDIKPGEFVGVLGLSGAGKSTFLRCLNRLIDPTSGEILFKKSFISDNPADTQVMDVC